MKRITLFIIGAALFGAFASWAHAQAYPAKPIRLILTVAGGGENSARLVAERLGEQLGAAVLVEAQPGAGGAVGATMVARAAPDGYTLLYGTTGAMVLRQFLVKNPGYDTLRDFTPIAQVGEAVQGIVANNDFAPSTLPQTFEFARRNPGKVAYGSSGTGTTSHLTGVLLNQMAGIDMLHVPYKSAAQAVTDLVGGRISLSMATMSTYTPLVEAGKIKLLAINAGRRFERFPDVPTVAELLPGYDRPPSWIGVFGPAGMTPAVVKRLSDGVVAVGNQPEVRSRLGAVGTMMAPEPAERFAPFVKYSVEFGGRLMKAAGIQPE